MKKPKLKNILKKILLLDAKKYRLLHKIYQEQLPASEISKNVETLKITIKKQLKIQQKLIYALNKLQVQNNIKEKLIHPVVETIGKLIAIEKAEYDIINDVTIFKIFLHKTKNLIKKDKETFFLHQGERFKQLYKRELELNSKLAKYIQRNIKSYPLLNAFSKQRERFYHSFKLLKQIQEELKEIQRHPKNSNLVQKNAQHILKLIEKIQKTLVYEFIEEDILKLQTRIEYIMEHPKESKMIYFLTSVYLISPGTFELTFIILFLRYSTKYALAKTKQLRR